MKKFYKNWFVHNMFGHPIMQLLMMLKCKNLGSYIHDATLPPIDKHV